MKIAFPIYLICAALWRFWYSKKGTRLRHPRSILLRSPQVLWAFLGMSVLSYLMSFFKTTPFPLPVACSLMAVYYAFRFGALQVFTLFFFILMCFSAVYLNHHYILDILWGSAYALMVAFSTDMIWNWLLKRQGIIVPGTSEELRPNETVG